MVRPARRCPIIPTPSGEFSWKLEVIDGGDHSFLLPKTTDSAQQAVYHEILQKTVTWLKSAQG